MILFHRNDFEFILRTTLESVILNGIDTFYWLLWFMTLHDFGRCIFRGVSQSRVHQTSSNSAALHEPHVYKLPAHLRKYIPQAILH